MKAMTSKGRILIVDDEPSIVDLLQEILTAFEYTPVGVVDPLQALRVFREEHASLDLVLTDLTMPNLPGLQLVQEMHKIDPAMPIIVLTGYTESLSEQEQKEYDITGKLNKPMMAGELIEAIDEALACSVMA